MLPESGSAYCTGNKIMIGTHADKELERQYDYKSRNQKILEYQRFEKSKSEAQEQSNYNKGGVRLSHLENKHRNSLSKKYHYNRNNGLNGSIEPNPRYNRCGDFNEESSNNRNVQIQTFDKRQEEGTSPKLKYKHRSRSGSKENMKNKSENKLFDGRQV